MERSKKCSKCQGNVFVDWDFGERQWFEYCLQCGRRHYLSVVAKAEDKPSGRAAKARASRRGAGVKVAQRTRKA